MTSLKSLRRLTNEEQKNDRYDILINLVRWVKWSDSHVCTDEIHRNIIIFNIDCLRNDEKFWWDNVKTLHERKFVSNEHYMI